MEQIISVDCPKDNKEVTRDTCWKCDCFRSWVGETGFSCHYKLIKEFKQMAGNVAALSGK